MVEAGEALHQCSPVEVSHRSERELDVVVAAGAGPADMASRKHSEVGAAAVAVGADGCSSLAVPIDHQPPAGHREPLACHQEPHLLDRHFVWHMRMLLDRQSVQ